MRRDGESERVSEVGGVALEGDEIKGSDSSAKDLGGFRLKSLIQTVHL